MTADNTGKILSTVSSVVIFIATVGYIFVYGVKPEIKDIVNQIIIAEIGWMTGSFGYWLGSSVGSAHKDQTIRDQLGTPPKP